MKWRFWKKETTDETIIQVQAREGGVTEIYVKAQSSGKAMSLFKELKEECLKK